MRKYLNSQRYTNLLRIIGMSPNPLSPYAIMVNKEFDGKNYVYEMIRNLCPSCHQNTVSRKLCVIEDLPEMRKNQISNTKLSDNLTGIFVLAMESERRKRGRNVITICLYK